MWVCAVLVRTGQTDFCRWTGRLEATGCENPEKGRNQTRLTGSSDGCPKHPPTDEDALAALRLQLKKLLQEDPDLRAEAERVLGNARTSSPTIVIVSGNRSVACGNNAGGNVIITGDNNKLQDRLSGLSRQPGKAVLYRSKIV